jgi:hypothetical protein
MSEKEKKLDKMQRKLHKIQKKFYKLIKELKETEEFDPRFDKLKWGSESIDTAADWISQEIQYQRKKIMKN